MKRGNRQMIADYYHHGMVKVPFDGQFDDGDAYSDVEDPNTIVSQPRQASKQVDVQTLKETLWHHIQESPQMPVQDQEEAVSFRDLLASFPSDLQSCCNYKGDFSSFVFICLLHLANEHGLSIRGCATLNDLSIHFPQ
ncbi:hypothetical protein NC653_033586 [Populus alba x Populus x berolinensis]|uniref:Condensin complex subunit 2 n=1 Tax=Populus alba x Populus x berolinensis TaxID=444605 RepID=A0AAD6PZA8_9ROSI|nr:hypothetical protein NC653_033586 [Populus alba x Populus x berolinensis]